MSTPETETALEMPQASAPKSPAGPKSAKKPKKRKKSKKLPPLEPKKCDHCGNTIDPKAVRVRSRADWAARRFCGTECRTGYNQTRAGREASTPKSYKNFVAAHQPSSAAMQELAKRVLARRSLLYFTKKTHPSYDAGWVHMDICRRLERFAQAVREKKSPRLMLLMPPRHGKSELASIRFPAWYLGHEPSHEIINVGYNLDLPMKFSRKVRELVRDPVYKGIFPQTALDPESGALEAWLTTMGGGFTAAGVGGGITGKGAHVLIVDDPIKNMEEADSATTRENLWDWFWSTAYTRLAPGGGVLLIQTWWNDDDLAGRIQQLSASAPDVDQYEVIKYPALAEAYEYRDEESLAITRTPTPEHDEKVEIAFQAPRNLGVDVPQLLPDSNRVLLRRPGDSLHPARYDADYLKQVKASMQPRIWSALYQQNPVPDEGMLFKKEYFRYAASLPSFQGCNVFTAWDFAIGLKQQNDWTVGATVFQDTSDTLYVLEVFRFRGDAFQIVESMLDVARRWTPEQGSYLLGVEDGQIWRSIEPLFKKRVAERRQYVAYEALKPLTDKLARARPLQGRMQQGKIVFPNNALWKSETEMELLRFPAAAHDDIVDALAWVVQLASGKPPPRAWSRPKPPSWKDKLNMLGSPGAVNHMGA